MLLDGGLLSLPLEVLCIIIKDLSPHCCLQLALASKPLYQAFEFNIKSILDQIVEGWGCLIFKCPLCNEVYRGSNSVSTLEYSYRDGEVREDLIKTCKKCRKTIRMRNASFMKDCFYRYVNEEKALPELADLAHKGICRYQYTYPPSNKDIKYMKSIMDRL